MSARLALYSLLPVRLPPRIRSIRAGCAIPSLARTAALNPAQVIPRVSRARSKCRSMSHSKSISASAIFQIGDSQPYRNGSVSAAWIASARISSSRLAAASRGTPARADSASICSRVGGGSTG
ncbi:MAG: hypothetical protein M0R06_08875 [Sphaerochaeta sp.]|nr:hypothetical protein [Sphaerochaeta sp.]